MRALIVGLLASLPLAAADPLPSWNDGAAKKAIVDLVTAVTDKASPKFALPRDRVAVFDEDGTTWVEHPLYTELVFSLDRVVEMAPQHPQWKDVEPFKSVLAGDKAAMAKFAMEDYTKLIAATHTGMTTDDFDKTAKAWMAKARDPRWKRPYTELVYQPMNEVMQYLRDNGFRTYIVTGGTQRSSARSRGGLRHPAGADHRHLGGDQVHADESGQRDLRSIRACC